MPMLNTSWPTRGQIEFRNYSLRYKQELNDVLINLNATIFAGEKIGIVGRTGAGKSTLIMALFRLIEYSTGSIYIDEIDINTVSVQSLRRNLTIIPQVTLLITTLLSCNSLKENFF